MFGHFNTRNVLSSFSLVQAKIQCIFFCLFVLLWFLFPHFANFASVPGLDPKKNHACKDRTRSGRDRLWRNNELKDGNKTIMDPEKAEQKIWEHPSNNGELFVKYQ